MTTIHDAIADVVQSLASEHVVKLATFLDATSAPTEVARLQASDLVALPLFRSKVATLWKAWQGEPAMPGFAIALALRAASQTHSQVRGELTATTVVTGPSSWHVPTRQTADVILELVNQAKESLLLTSFAAYKVPSLIAALKSAVARGVSVQMLLETVEDSGGALTHDAKQAFAAIPGVTVLIWPAERRVSEGAAKASMHAKVVIADRDSAFVTSANLTGAALERNLEVGVLVSGGPLPGKLMDHFAELQSKGDLKALST